MKTTHINVLRKLACIIAVSVYKKFYALLGFRKTLIPLTGRNIISGIAILSDICGSNEDIMNFRSIVDRTTFSSNRANFCPKI